MINFPIKSLTDEWVALFERDVENGLDIAASPFWRLSLMCGPSYGVDRSDARVVNALEEIQKAVEKRNSKNA